MKHRRMKARWYRMAREALRSEKRELGDHRRWWWQATMPYDGEDRIGKYTVFFDAKCGRSYLYRDLTETDNTDS